MKQNLTLNPKLFTLNLLFFFLYSLFSPSFLFSQTDTDIYLFDISVSDQGVEISNPINITNRKGYDNQAHFHADNNQIFYSSFDSSGRSDIKVYDIESKKTSKFCSTQSREYSPTLTPDGKYISCIIQTDDGKQNLGKYPINGGDPIIIIDDLIVGYHAWINENELLLFVLGEPHHFLVSYDLRDSSKDTIASNIGRSLHKIPGTNDMSFVQKSDKDWSIMSLNSNKGITKTLKEREDLCWTNNGFILMSDGSDLFYFDKEWKKVTYKGDKSFMKGITRLAINVDNTKLSVVVEE